MPKNTYITTSIPYVNAKPHIGHALELVQADALARYRRLTGEDVTFQTGTDENAYKNVLAARQAGVAVEELVGANAERFRRLISALDISADGFIRTTEARHRIGVERLWKRLAEGDLYRGVYEGLYCSGCEDFLREADLEDGRCPDHMVPPESVRELNWYFRLSRYQSALDEAISGGRLRIVPEQRRQEVLGFIRSGLKDISVSRDSGRLAGWGIPVPGDPAQTIYVWIDALMNYITGRGDGGGDGWERSWNRETLKIHVVGKNVWKFHAVYWPALLLSAGLPLPDELFVHGFLTIEGRKISKSLGNTVDPFDAADRLGSDSLRHYLLGLSPFEDGDYSEAQHSRLHDSRLANGIGNLVLRVATLCEKAGISGIPLPAAPDQPSGLRESMEEYRLDRALESLQREVDAVNGEIDAAKPWNRLADPASRELIIGWGLRVHRIGYWLRLFCPNAAERIVRTFSATPIRKDLPIFGRASA
jgi:methionyl-tRNA synthetase